MMESAGPGIAGVETTVTGMLGDAHPAAEATPDRAALSASASKLARSLAWIPGQRESRDFSDRYKKLMLMFQPILDILESPPAADESEDFRWLRENILLLEAELRDISATFQYPHRIPQVQTREGAVVSRIAAVAGDFLGAADFQFSEAAFSIYVQVFQEITVLQLVELWMLIPMMKLALLERAAERASLLLANPSTSDGIQRPVRSLQEIKHANWKDIIEPLILFDRVLRTDPAGYYSGMDYESRELYRREIVNIADRSDCDEVQVATHALALARQAQEGLQQDARVALRASHIGCYLLAEGREVLEEKVGFNPRFGNRFRAWLRKHPDDFLLPGIAILTLAIVSGVVLFLTRASTPLSLVFLSLLAVLLPASQSAVQMMNYVVTWLLPAQILPKLNFSRGLPSNCATLVAIPTMLMDEKQVRKLVDALEVRFLGNQDPNLHYALLTDLPDSPSEPLERDNPLVELAGDLVRQLNERYAAKKMGSFLLLHRHRVYNPRERLWMGWERKRGKLMDLNNLMRGQFDSFPVKVGNLSILPDVRYVITLDSDTELPRGSARRMVGAIAHPLNQAIIDRELGAVVAGYGILQPRVGVSVQSTARSRLASIYSGQTGLDIYTHATSDVYQDLYGEGIFVGKGIYEVQTLHEILHGRFPRNALLSHDLIEGAYARAGLVSDIEVIEDYPSHYSAHNRRKHRWVRGDWQIMEWLLPMVPDESGRRVPNPLSVISSWKILDNLRRSLVEPALFLLFVLGWLCLPGGPVRWSLAAIFILFLPALFQLAVELVEAVLARRSRILGALDGFVNACMANGLIIVFLAHQALLSMDAVVRTMVRRLITRQRLLEWETAAEAELAGDKRTMLDIYLNWTPALAAVLFVLVYLVNKRALPAAIPILLLWAASKPISQWLNRPPRAPRKEISERYQRLLRTSALRTWRYFAEFSTEEHHWLIPDNVVEEGRKVAPRISPTNLGFLFNVRQVACDFGYLTVPELVKLNLRTLATAFQMERHQGHFLNWYDTRTLAPLTPAIVSSVDNGNLVASLWTLQQGARQLLHEALLPRELSQGLIDHLYLLTTMGALSRRKFSAIERSLRGQKGLPYLLRSWESLLGNIRLRVSKVKDADEAGWLLAQVEERLKRIQGLVQLYGPWLLAEFASLGNDPEIRLQNRAEDLPALERMPSFIDTLSLRLQAAIDSSPSGENGELYRDLLALLPEARGRVVTLIEEIRKLDQQAGQLADEMDFGFLFNRRRNLLSVAFEVEKQQLLPACYDLLASEARIAYFIAIGKDEIPQESWFQLGRAPVEHEGMVGLLSWTGTMFEYLMPALWMRTYPNTLLERSKMVAVQVQQEYAAGEKVPWGISESGCAKLDDAGNYQYFPFGVPDVAIHKPDYGGPVISPYSTVIALSIDPPAALRNLRTMQRQRWMGPYGFYEALDFTPSHGRSRSRRPRVVRCWMAHHQGMSLLSIANFLHEGVVQGWFHSHPRVQATELLLQEKPVGHYAPSAAGAKAA
jgi:hypothetical protein